MKNVDIHAVSRLSVQAQKPENTSYWVNANAGSGKTKFLIDRLLLLLLKGELPESLLCITYTRAAAYNMYTRLSAQLASWISLDNEQLYHELTQVLGSPPNETLLEDARLLYSKVTEPYQKLTFTTFHALCEKILKEYPAESKIYKSFMMIPEDETRKVLTHYVDELLFSKGNLSPELHADLKTLLQTLSKYEVIESLNECLNFRTLLDLYPIQHTVYEDNLLAQLGLSEHIIQTDQWNSYETGIDWEMIRGAYASSSAHLDRELAKLITQFLSTSSYVDFLALFYTKTGKPKAPRSLGTKSIPNTIVALMLDAQHKIVQFKELQDRKLIFTVTTTLFRLASWIYGRLKIYFKQHSVMDYDTLILSTLGLLTSHDSRWVHYRLDQKYHHILLDEAQDTNIIQWSILYLLSEDFLSDSESSLLRTHCIVGDPKQSIFSFQGVAPNVYQTQFERFKKHYQSFQKTLQSVNLTRSYRSSPLILKAVDAVFNTPEHKTLETENKALYTCKHEAARVQPPGQIELWSENLAPPPYVAADRNLSDSAYARTAYLARLVHAIRFWSSHTQDSMPQYSYDDILILFHRRGSLYTEFIQALDQAGIPNLGRDRIDLYQHPLFLLCLSIAKTSLNLEHDLSLAVVLASQVFRFTTKHLKTLFDTNNKHTSVYTILLQLAQNDPEIKQIVNRLNHWNHLAYSTKPAEFYETVLLEPYISERLAQLFGTEWIVVIEMFLEQLNTLEQRFLGFTLRDCVSHFGDFNPQTGKAQSIRREVDRTRDSGVRVMTIHGAKGLEAPLVVLVDEHSIAHHPSKLIPVDLEESTWLTETLPIAICPGTRDSILVNQLQNHLEIRTHFELDRLLYVALTRAQYHLIILPPLRITKKHQNSWFNRISEQLTHSNLPRGTKIFPYGEVTLFYEHESQIR